MAAYDGLRVFRGVVRHRMLWINIEDFLYWVIVGLAAFVFLLRENDGVIRWYAIAGMGGGILLFSLGISRFTVPVLTWALRLMLGTPLRALRKVVMKMQWFCNKHRKS